jgi:hypothetical protein
MQRFLTLIIIALLVVSCGRHVFVGVQVTDEKELSQITFQITGEDKCRPSFRVPLNRQQKWGLHYTSNCYLPVSELPLLLSRLLDTLTKTVELDTLGWVWWGPIYNFESSPTDSSEFASRLTTAAFHSPEWNRQTGQPKSLPLDGFLVKLMNDERVFAEVIDVFAEHGISLKVAGVEKIGILAARESPN